MEESIPYDFVAHFCVVEWVQGVSGACFCGWGWCGFFGGDFFVFRGHMTLYKCGNICYAMNMEKQAIFTAVFCGLGFPI
jgi:hypothetical protein